MKFTVKNEILNEGIRTVGNVSPKTLTLPVLNNLLMKVEKNFLSLTTTDLEIGIRWFSLVKTEEEGEVLLPIKIFSTLLNFLPSSPLTVQKQDLNVKIACGNYQTQIKGQNSEDFPLLPQIKEEETVVLEGESFCQSLNQVLEIASPSTVKPEISGIYFILEKDLIRMVATDSFRLAEKKLFLKEPLSKEYSFILPQKTAREIVNIFSGKENKISLFLSPNQVMFETLMAEIPHPQIQIISRLIEGEYPNYQEIIPKKYETQVVCQKTEFLNQIKGAAIFSGKISAVQLKINPKESRVEISSQNPDLGVYQSFFSAKIKGSSQETSFNYRFLAEGLSNIASSEVVFEMTGPDKPAVLKPSGDENYLYVVMPIKTN